VAFEIREPREICGATREGTPDGTDVRGKARQGASPFNPIEAHSINDLILHLGADFTASSEKRKTYGRLFGMIFLGVACPTLVVEMQRLKPK
jgi:hypothetical protein